MLTIGSVCSGAGTAELIARDIGVAHAWCSEVELSACAVLPHRFGASAPEHPPYWLDAKKTAAWHKGVRQMAWGSALRNVGDMTVLPDLIREGKVEAPDIFTGGTPCQAFSVAGKRGGLNDRRGNLTLTFVEIADAIDDVRQAVGRMGCGIVWENVPGVLSDKTNAFGCFLGALAGYEAAVVSPGGKFAGSGVVVGPRRRVAWCVLDAQYFGVPQRRRRVFVVAVPVDATSVDGLGGIRPEVILALGSCLRRNTPTRNRTGQDAASPAGSAAAEDCIPIDTMNHVARGPDHWREFSPGDPSYTLSKGHSHAVAIPPQTQYGDIAGALTARHDSSPCADRGMNVVAFAQNQCGEVRTGDVANTLGTNSNASGRNTPMVAQEPITFGWQEARNFRALDDGSTNTSTKNQTQAVAIGDVIPIDTLTIQGRPGDTKNRQGKGYGEIGDPQFTLSKGHHHAVAIGPHWDDPSNPHPSLTQSHNTGGIAASNQELFSQRGAGLVQQSVAFVQNTRDEVRLMGGDGQTVGALAAQPGMKQQCYIAQGIDKASSSPFSDLSPTIKTDLGQGMGPCVCSEWRAGDQANAESFVELAGTISYNKGSHAGIAAIEPEGVLRRLMPVEAERLMGWPDGFTSVPFRGKPMTDGHRYKICGNGWAYPVARWVIEGLKEAME